MPNHLSRISSTLDRWQDRSRVLDCIEALGDRLPLLHMPRSSRAAARRLGQLCRVIAFCIGAPSTLGTAAGRAITRMSPTDQSMERMAARFVEVWASAIEDRMPLMAARVRRKNGLSFLAGGAGS